MRGKKRNLYLLGISSIDQGRATSFTQWPNWYAPISKGPLGEEPLTIINKPILYFTSDIVKYLVYQLFLT